MIKSKGSFWTILGVCLAGSGLALYATQQTIRIQNFDLQNPLLCTVNEWINCNLALASSYALRFGVPEAWWGFMFYLAIAAAIIAASLTKKMHDVILESAFVLTCIAVLYSIHKAYLLAFELQVLCPVCAGMYLANIALVVLVMKLTGISFSEMLKPFKSLLSSRGPPVVLMFIVLMGGGFAAIKWHLKGLSRLQLDIAEEVRKHFAQERSELEIPDHAPMWGNPEARVTIVKFSDFQCPTCRKAAFKLKETLWEFRNDIRFVFINFPLDKAINPYVRTNLHPNAGVAAQAATCAQEQGDFWGFHDDIFRNQQDVDPRFLLRLAKKRCWDLEAFAECMYSEDTQSLLRSHIDLAHDSGVNSTPSIFINGQRLTYWSQPEVVRGIIKQAQLPKPVRKPSSGE